MNPIEYVLAIAFLLTSELLYLRVARHVGLVDIPNERSLHTNRTTVRGGGIVFWLAALVQFIDSDFEPAYFFVGLSLVAAASFLDDVRSLAWQYRICAQLVAMSLLMYETAGFSPALWIIVLLVVAGIGVLNAFNFMDGINGMTAFYGLLTAGTLWYGQTQYLVGDAGVSLLLSLTVVALLIFGCFNARPQSVCFAGDVGSVSIGFSCLYALIELIKASQSYLPVLFLAAYGIDTILTMSYRFYLGQNIVQAHRLHLFQRLVYVQQWPHLLVAALYTAIQLGINLLVLCALRWSFSDQLLLAIVVLGLLTTAYGAIRLRLAKTQKRVDFQKPTPQFYVNRQQ